MFGVESEEAEKVAPKTRIGVEAGRTEEVEVADGESPLELAELRRRHRVEKELQRRRLAHHALGVVPKGPECGPTKGGDPGIRGGDGVNQPQNIRPQQELEVLRRETPHDGGELLARPDPSKSGTRHPPLWFDRRGGGGIMGGHGHPCSVESLQVTAASAAVVEERGLRRE